MFDTLHHWLPIVLAVYLPVSFIITYSMAAGYEHVEPAFPYISDTGTTPPESCVFAQLLNIGAVLAGMIIYIKYRHGLCHFENTGRKHLIRLNIASLILGMLSALGVSIVANFQETNIFSVHIIGAFLAFLIGLVYMILQTIISYKSAACTINGNTLKIRRVRFGLCAVHSLLVIVLIVTAKVATSKGPAPGKSKRLWSSEDPGYAEHLVATISEWLMAFLTVIYFATFHWEFKHFRIKPPEVVYDQEEERTVELFVIT